jgi:GAF domain-containing protein
VPDFLNSPWSYDRDTMPDARRDRDPSLGRLVDEQVALRRVATLVARGVRPDEIFSAVSDEVGRLLDAEATIARFEGDGSATVVVGLSEGIPEVPIGTRSELEDFVASSAVYRTGRPARDDHASRRDASGPVADSLRRTNFVSTVAAPIVVEGRLWGVMTVADDRATLPPDTEEHIERFTDLVGTAIANAESRSALHRLVEEQAALQRVATQVARGLSPDEIFNAVSNEVSRLLGCEQAVVERFEAGGSELIVVGASEEAWITSIGDRWELEDFLATTAVHRTARPARVDLAAARDASGPVADRLREIGFISAVAAPIVVEGSLWGVITVADTTADLPLDTEVRLEHFAELVATAIANAESRAELAASEARAHELAREQTALRRVAALVADGASAEHIFAAVSQEVVDLSDIPVVGVHRFEPDRTFSTMGVAGETRFPVGSRWSIEDEGLAAMILATGRPGRREDYTGMAGPLGAAMRDDRMVATVGAPIVVDGRLWGFIVAAARPGKPIPDNAEDRLARFTELVATAIGNSQAREHLAQLAEEQAALRRVATIVARGSPPEQLFAQVAEEVGLLLGVEMTGIHRFEPDGYATILTNWGKVGEILPLDRRVKLDGDSVTARVYRTARPARIDSYESASGPIASGLRKIGMRAGVGSPIVVNGRLWGAIAAVTSRADALPADSEARIAEFTGLVATAIANVEARSEVQQLAEEQAALRRVATLVARGVSPDEIFSAVSNEVGRLFGSDQAAVARFEPDGSAMVFVGVSEGMRVFSIGTRVKLEDFYVATAVQRTARPARREPSSFDSAASAIPSSLRDMRAFSRLGTPIVVEGSLWGVMSVVDMHNRLPSDAEERLEKFTELVGTAIANAESRAEIAASRTRIIAAADDTRRRIERDLHDGAQQRLVTLAVALRRAEATVPDGLDELRADISRVAGGLTVAVDDLREISRGIHPAVLTEGGLSPALRALGRRSAIRVKLDIRFEDRLPDHVEVAAYYTVSEALTNASKHAGATRVWVSLRAEENTLNLSIRDDGAGGADPSRGTGLIGLRDRIEALGGTIEIESPPGEGTRIDAKIPGVLNQGIDVPTLTKPPSRTLTPSSTSPLSSTARRSSTTQTPSP